MTKRHTISINDFQEYVIKQKIASSVVKDDYYKSLTVVFVPRHNEIMYRVECNDKASGHATLEEAIEVYNEL